MYANTGIVQILYKRLYMVDMTGAPDAHPSRFDPP